MACGGRLSSNPVCPSLSPAGGCGPCGLYLPLRERPRGSDLRPIPGTNLQTRTTARCRALRLRGLPSRVALRRLLTRTTLPRDGCPPLAPLAVANVAGAVTPISAGLRRFQARKPFPACGVVLDHPASNEGKCSAPAPDIQAIYDAFRRASRTLEVRRGLSSPREIESDKTPGNRGSGLCAVGGKDPSVRVWPDAKDGDDFASRAVPEPNPPGPRCLILHVRFPDSFSSWSGLALVSMYPKSRMARVRFKKP